MKVLIETITSRKGYKFFENREEMDAYLGRHCNKIASYEILQEDDVNSTNGILQGLAEECEVLENKLFYIIIPYFFGNIKGRPRFRPSGIESSMSNNSGNFFFADTVILGILQVVLQ